MSPMMTYHGCYYMLHMCMYCVLVCCINNNYFMNVILVCLYVPALQNVRSLGVVPL